jgi:uncharacterized coiled-coil DUF342 family protein
MNNQEMKDEIDQSNLQFENYQNKIEQLEQTIEQLNEQINEYKQIVPIEQMDNISSNNVSID